MLVLSRKCGERIGIGPNIELTVTKLSKSRVRLAIDAPKEIKICRQELRHQTPDESGTKAGGSLHSEKKT